MTIWCYTLISCHKLGTAKFCCPPEPEVFWDPPATEFRAPRIHLRKEHPFSTKPPPFGTEAAEKKTNKHDIDVLPGELRHEVPRYWISQEVGCLERCKVYFPEDEWDPSWDGWPRIFCLGNSLLWRCSMTFDFTQNIVFVRPEKERKVWKCSLQIRGRRGRRRLVRLVGNHQKLLDV